MWFGAARAGRTLALVDDRHARRRRRPADPRRGPWAGYRALRAGAFERLVTDVLARIGPPADVAVTVEDLPPAAALDPSGAVPLTRTDEGAGGRRIVLYRRALEARAATRGELAELVRGVLLDALEERGE